MGVWLFIHDGIDAIPRYGPLEFVVLNTYFAEWTHDTVQGGYCI